MHSFSQIDKNSNLIRSVRGPLVIIVGLDVDEFGMSNRFSNALFRCLAKIMR